MSIPIHLNAQTLRVLFVGGGNVATRKVRTLHNQVKDITVMAPEISEELSSLPLHFIPKAYDSTYLKKFNLVYACTDNIELNKKIFRDCSELNIHCSVMGAAREGSFVSPTFFKHKGFQISISSDAINPKKILELKEKIQEFLKDER